MLRDRDRTRPREPESAAVRIVIIDDDASDRERVSGIVRSDVAPVDIVEIDDHVSFFQALKNPDFDLVITEQDLHWSSGLEVLTAVKSLRPTLPVIMVARSEDEAVAAAALREGLDAYIPKSGELAIRLRSSIRSALRRLEIEDRAGSLEARLKGLLDRLNVGVFRSTVDGRILEANAAFLRLVGVPSLKPSRVLRLEDLFVDPARHRELVSRLAADGQVRDLQAELARSDGTRVWVSFTETLQANGREERLVDGLLEDASASRAATNALEQANMDYRAVFEIATSATVIVDSSGTVAMVNSAFERMSGHRRADLEGARRWLEMVAPADVERVSRQIDQVLQSPQGSPQSMRFDLIDHAKREVHVLATMALLRGSRRLVVSLLNLTDRQQVEEQLLHNAFHDGLTGLPNRLSMLDRIETLLASHDGAVEESFALVLFGLDRFRVINNSLGHRVGDLLLQAVTRRLEGAIDGCDLFCRCGGDVFGLIVRPAGDAQRAIEVARAVEQALAKPFSFGNHTAYCMASFGVDWSDGSRDASELYRDAETALYDAKHAGGGRLVVFEPALHQRAWRTYTVETDLRRALANRELTVRYQPMVSLVDGEIVGFEVLARWLQPSGELVMPGGFLDVAEATGLIVPIGRTVLREACESLRHWLDSGSAPPSLFLSVNLSRRQLRHPALVDDIGEALRRARLEPSRLMLEITEGALDNGVAGGSAVLSSLHAGGFGLCLDGFGRADSSLALLSAGPFSTVKIDRSFLAGIGQDRGRWRLVDGMHALAVHLGLRPIAVGIEQRDQLNRLLDLGCSLGQGMLLAEPVDEAGARQLLSSTLTW